MKGKPECAFKPNQDSNWGVRYSLWADHHWNHLHLGRSVSQFRLVGRIVIKSVLSEGEARFSVDCSLLQFLDTSMTTSKTTTIGACARFELSSQHLPLILPETDILMHNLECNLRGLRYLAILVVTSIPRSAASIDPAAFLFPRVSRASLWIKFLPTARMFKRFKQRLRSLFVFIPCSLIFPCRDSFQSAIFRYIGAICRSVEYAVLRFVTRLTRCLELSGISEGLPCTSGTPLGLERFCLVTRQSCE